jgi:hypothetical protein
MKEVSLLLSILLEVPGRILNEPLVDRDWIPCLQTPDPRDRGPGFGSHHRWGRSGEISFSVNYVITELT